MKALPLFAIAVLGLTSCGDNLVEEQTESDPRPRSEKRSKLTALSKDSDRPRTTSPRTRQPRSELPAREKRTGEVVLPKDISSDPEALARQEEVRRSAALKREEEQARREAQRADRVARMAEQFTARLKEMDANGDGFLAKDEISGPLERRFADADTNSDGFLDSTEQQAIFENLANRIGEASRGGRDRRSGGGRDGRGGRRR